MLVPLGARDCWYTVHTTFLDASTMKFLVALLNRDVAAVIADYSKEVFIEHPCDHVVPYLVLRPRYLPPWEEDPDA